MVNPSLDKNLVYDMKEPFTYVPLKQLTYITFYACAYIKAPSWDNKMLISIANVGLLNAKLLIRYVLKDMIKRQIFSSQTHSE